jgi:fused signal recognition particle receptor
MSFFGKLKNRLFKTSSKLDEGLDAIVEEGSEETAADDASADAPAPEAPMSVMEPMPLPEETEPQGTRRPGLLGRLIGQPGTRSRAAFWTMTCSKASKSC